MNNLTIGGIDPRTRANSALRNSGRRWERAQPCRLERDSYAHDKLSEHSRRSARVQPTPYVCANTVFGEALEERVSTQGDGAVREVEVLTQARMSMLADRRKHGPYGLNGGEAGQPGGPASFIKGGRGRSDRKEAGSWKRATVSASKPRRRWFWRLAVTAV